MLFDLASHLHKTVHELQRDLSIDELVGWIAWFQLKAHPEPDGSNTDDHETPEQQYAAFRQVLD